MLCLMVRRVTRLNVLFTDALSKLRASRYQGLWVR
jgi:hypothetical protein